MEVQRIWNCNWLSAKNLVQSWIIMRCKFLGLYSLLMCFGWRKMWWIKGFDYKKWVTAEPSVPFGQELEWECLPRDEIDCSYYFNTERAAFDAGRSVAVWYRTLLFQVERIKSEMTTYGKSLNKMARDVKILRVSTRWPLFGEVFSGAGGRCVHHARRWW